MTMEKIKVVADFDWLENEETIGLLGHEMPMKAICWMRQLLEELLRMLLVI